MKDWKGNEVVPGDTLVFVSIVPPTSPGLVLILDKDTNEIRQVKASIEKGPGWDWRPYYESEVVSIHETPHIKIPGPDGTPLIYTPVDLVAREAGRTNTIALCVKGKSDKEEEFFADFFKPHMN